MQEGEPRSWRPGTFSKKKAKKISKLLRQKLGPEFISYRPGFNMSKIAYVEGWMAISLANRIFGFNGWSSEIRSMTIDYEEGGDKKIGLGVSCLVRVMLKDGTYREDIGFGSSENQKSKAIAYEKAKKEAATDALKRALRQFGNSLGNCCYDKNYIKEIQRIHKINEKALDSNDLFRNNAVVSEESDKDGDASFEIDCHDLSDTL
ncbi:Rad52-like DNA repair and recombination protein [Encephalitozoon intestinalis ATCC 50506]|uniref:Rad52-like DNA repair and recombination protein n=1 Tax=Encephalitozoon intestinalis (strain ATCC 50506) TaxID=876142 RepID=E0S8V2_ENCIT|nr:Rad52-like DNA repair and recombination protein [Encephalitozoon intestinalis ATCC 50506]ADM12218.1 Rad52-like DNA repair and recombination protein [Encephalitozoon intestinalis ATCC 50506]UTX46027.1 DNA repair and recombination protein RAD52 [Encephalitozoon intestinalis]